MLQLVSLTVVECKSYLCFDSPFTADSQNENQPDSEVGPTHKETSTSLKFKIKLWYQNTPMICALTLKT